MDKIRISKKLHDSIEYMKVQGYSEEMIFINVYENRKCLKAIENTHLRQVVKYSKELNLIDLAFVLNGHYEIFETKEENLSELYFCFRNNKKDPYCAGFSDGIKYVVNELELKIDLEGK